VEYSGERNEYFYSASKFFRNDATRTLGLARPYFEKKHEVKKQNMDLFYITVSHCCISIVDYRQQKRNEVSMI